MLSCKKIDSVLIKLSRIKMIVFFIAFTNFFLCSNWYLKKRILQNQFIYVLKLFMLKYLSKTNRRNLSLYKNHGQSLSKRFALGKNHILSSVSFFYVAFPLHKCIINKKKLTYQNCLTYWIFLHGVSGLWVITTLSWTVLTLINHWRFHTVCQ